MTPSIRLLLDLLDEAFDRKAWHGTTLLGSIRGVPLQVAVWRPGPGRHNIWELAVHTAYWKYAVRRALTGEKRGSFALKGSNWFPCGSDTPSRTAPESRPSQSWAGDVRLLVEEHRLLRDVIAALDDRALAKRLKGKPYTAAYMVRGIAAHDLYHAGQIQLIKRLHGPF